LDGVFGADRFRAAWITRMGGAASAVNYDQSVDAALDALAAHVEAHLDVDLLLSLAAETRTR